MVLAWGWGGGGDGFGVWVGGVLCLCAPKRDPRTPGCGHFCPQAPFLYEALEARSKSSRKKRMEEGAAKKAGSTATAIVVLYAVV
jgi:hypothetical protein